MSLSPVHIISDNVITPLGFTTSVNFEQISEGQIAIELLTDPAIYPEPFYASKISDEQLETLIQDEFSDFTRLEKLLILSVEQALYKTEIDPTDDDVIFVFSTTKGNIDLLEKSPSDVRLNLWHTASVVSGYFGNPNTPVTISNACVSGVAALGAAMDLLQYAGYKHAIVFGGDLVTRFVVSGFMSLKAFSPQPCSPYSPGRLGVNLGEGAATMILSTTLESPLQIMGHGLKNDANHISGPSRSGEGLILAVQEALHQSGISTQEIDHISAHGTGTEFNDEMESQAFFSLGMSSIPLNSLKGAIGHTLGASGLIECALLAECMRRDVVLPTVGFRGMGVGKPLQVSAQSQVVNLKHSLKTASGFGGANAAIIFRKNG